MAARLVRSLCGGESERWRQAEAGAMGALRARMALWDGMLAAMGRLSVAS
jgi:hypothetical protein